MRRETFSTPEPAALVLRVTAGAVYLETADVVETTVELEGLNESGRKAVEEARVEQHGREVLVDVDRRHSGFRISIGRGPEVRVSVTAPHGSTLDCSCVSAEVKVTGRLASAELKAVSGDVAVEAIDGDAWFKTVSGDVKVDRVGGEVTLNSVSGNLLVRELGRSGNAKTVSGDVALESIGEGEAVLQTVSGDIRVGVRPGATIWMDVKSISGRTSSELDVADVPPAGGSSRLEIRASSVSGDIRIARAAPVHV